MPRQLKMPSTEELPPGARRRFVEELWVHYRAARRPTVREVADGVAAGDYKGTTSREQFRLMMAGLTIPSNWDNVEAVLLLLCTRYELDPETDRWPHDSYPGDFVSWRSYLFDLWNDALDEPYPLPRPAPVAHGYDDEPPF